MPTITPFLWFDSDAVEAAQFYASIFPDAKINGTMANTGDAPGLDAEALTVSFELQGQQFTGLNGGPFAKFNESISFVVHCKDQEEVDYYWAKLGEGGEFSQCGWLKDKFGLSWQITPDILLELISDPDLEKASRVMKAMMQMTKIEIAPLQTAYDGVG